MITRATMGMSTVVAMRAWGTSGGAPFTVGRLHEVFRVDDRPRAALRQLLGERKLVAPRAQGGAVETLESHHDVAADARSNLAGADDAALSDVTRRTSDPVVARNEALLLRQQRRVTVAAPAARFVGIGTLKVFAFPSGSVPALSPLPVRERVTLLAVGTAEPIGLAFPASDDGLLPSRKPSGGS